MANKSYVYPASTLQHSRNKFKMPHTLKTSFNHGSFVPFDWIECVPGDTIKCDLAALVRMSTPIAPIMDNITMHFGAYWVPYRLLDEHFEEIMGANKTGAWTNDKYTGSVGNVEVESVAVNSIGDYLGLPNSLASTAAEGGQAAIKQKVSVYPGRAYYKIWNFMYRNQNVSAPKPVALTGNHILVSDDATTQYNADCLKLGKYADYFTKCLPQAQKSDPVGFIAKYLPIGTFATADNAFTEFSVIDYDDSGYGALEPSGSGMEDVDGQIKALVSPNVVNINSLRVAFQLQKFYEKDARYGTRYFEMLNGHFGVTNNLGVLQEPEFLGEFNFRINVDQVLSTAGYAATSSTTVGAPGANSVTGKKGSLFTKSVTEFGLIMIVGGARHDHTYGQGYERKWQRFDRLDFYDPLFANIGEQPVYRKEIYAAGSKASDAETVFGYQEAWAELRFIPDRTSGLMSPARANSLDFWTLADKYESAPLLNEDFIYENRNSISRALVTGVSGPDYIADIYFDITAVRELPLFSIPGLADHH